MMKKYISPDLKISIYPEESIADIFLSLMDELIDGEENDTWEAEEW